MNSLIPLMSAIATVIAAFIAAVITFLTSVFSKEAKISEFRQAWIDALRVDIARFIAIWWHVVNECEQFNGQEIGDFNAAFWKDLKPELLEIEELQMRIELRLNPKEHQALLSALRTLVKVSDFVGRPVAEQRSAAHLLRDETQTVLGKEWRVVKRGERTYRNVKLLSIILIIVTSLILVTGVLVRRYGTYDRSLPPGSNSASDTGTTSGRAGDPGSAQSHKGI
jgi:hypothetical protein